MTNSRVDGHLQRRHVFCAVIVVSDADDGHRLQGGQRQG